MKLSSNTKMPVGATLIVLSSLFYASYGIWTTLMGDFFGGYTASAFRSILVLFILFPFALYYRQLGPVGWKHNWQPLLGLVLSATLVWGPFYYAILHAGVGVSLTINYASLVIGMFLFGWLLGKERFTLIKGISAGVGFIGLWLVFAPNTAQLGLIPLSAAAISGFASSLHYVIAKQISYNATQSTIAMWVASTLANLVMAFVLQEHIPALSFEQEWFYLILFAIASVASTWLFVRGIKLIDAGIAGVLGLLEIVFGILFGMLFFHEQPGFTALVGALVIIIAASIPYVTEEKTSLNKK